MNPSESALFKILMWTVTTLMGIVTIGVMAILTVVIETKTELINHVRSQERTEVYYMGRCYTDSININTLFVHVNQINQIIRIIAPEEWEQMKTEGDLYLRNRLEATLPKNEHDIKPLNN